MSQLNSTDINFLKNLPLFLRFGSVTILHGGIQNHQRLDEVTKKDKDRILRLRYLNKEHRFVHYGEEDDSSIFWADLYDGNEGFVVYGHQSFKGPKKKQPRSRY